MKVVVNRCYGGFSLSHEAAKKLNLDSVWAEVSRINPVLVELVETDPSASGKHAKLAVMEIPDEVTDWLIDEYDGFETILYVVNGKIHRA